MAPTMDPGDLPQLRVDGGSSALDAVRALERHDWPKDAQVLVRIGIHTRGSRRDPRAAHRRGRSRAGPPGPDLPRPDRSVVRIASSFPIVGEPRLAVRGCVHREALGHRRLIHRTRSGALRIGEPRELAPLGDRQPYQFAALAGDLIQDRLDEIGQAGAMQV